MEEERISGQQWGRNKQEHCCCHPFLPEDEREGRTEQGVLKIHSVCVAFG